MVVGIVYERIQLVRASAVLKSRSKVEFNHLQSTVGKYSSTLTSLRLNHLVVKIKVDSIVFGRHRAIVLDCGNIFFRFAHFSFLRAEQSQAFDIGSILVIDKQLININVAATGSLTDKSDRNFLGTLERIERELIVCPTTIVGVKPDFRAIDNLIFTIVGRYRHLQFVIIGSGNSVIRFGFFVVDTFSNRRVVMEQIERHERRLCLADVDGRSSQSA